MRTPARFVMIVVLASLSLGACSESDLSRDAHPTTLTGTVWRAVSVAGQAPVAGGEPTIAFTDAQVKGSAGCNSYFGSYRYDPTTGAIQFQQLAMTAMACLDAARGGIEARFTQAINQVTSASIDPEGRLVLIGPGGEIVFAVDGVGS